MLAITGATGRLGRLVIDCLRDTVAADQLVALVRDPAKAADLRGAGVTMRKADYDRRETLGPALAGVDKLLLISGDAIGRRTAQHRAVIDAAGAAGVGFIAYTSVLHADRSPLAVAPDHRDTEAALAASGIAHVVLRNGWYTENRLASLPAILASGVLAGAAGDGRVSSATREDYAAAAAAVLTREGHAGRTYELAGDDAWTLADLAAEITRQSDRDVRYRELSCDEYQASLQEGGVPPTIADVLAQADEATRGGALFDDGGDLRRLIGRPTTPLAMAVKNALAVAV